jgi:hypothetical protein
MRMTNTERVTLHRQRKRLGLRPVTVIASEQDHPLTILADQAIEIVGIEKKVMVGRVMRSAYWLNHDPSGLVDAGYGLAV